MNDQSDRLMKKKIEMNERKKVNSIDGERKKERKKERI